MHTDGRLREREDMDELGNVDKHDEMRGNEAQELTPRYKHRHTEGNNTGGNLITKLTEQPRHLQNNNKVDLT